jgi:hypothetical protein
MLANTSFTQSPVQLKVRRYIISESINYVSSFSWRYSPILLALKVSKPSFKML